VDECALADIQKLDAGIWKGATWRGVRVPSLTEILATVPAGRRLFIELKAAEGLAPALRRAVTKSAVEAGRIVLISFEAAALGEAKRVLPDCRTLLLADTPEGKPAKLPGLIGLCHQDGFDGLGVSAGWPVDAGLVRRLQAENLQVHVWTVNDAQRARELASAGVASITTDRPGWLRQKLNQP
jgi:glycerophosphoryl diester phosphodiesterase